MSRHVHDSDCIADALERIADRLDEMVAPRVADATPPLVDGCRVVNRGDGNYSCLVHYRYWPMGSGICPARTGR